MKYRVFSKGCGKVDGFDGGYGMCRRLRVALASKPSPVREGGICPRAEMSKKAKLSSEDSEGIFYGFESFSCYFTCLDGHKEFNQITYMVLVALCCTALPPCRRLDPYKMPKASWKESFAFFDFR